VAEETRNASVAAPRGIVTSVLVSVIGGFVLLYSITASIPDRSEQGLTALAASATGLPPAQIFLDALGSPSVAKFLLIIVCVAQFFCGMASVTANSRMSYAFSRDHALPGSRIWSKVNARTGTPTNSVWLCVVLSVLLASPALFSSTAYFAVTSIAVIGLYIAYVVPVFLRRVNRDFTPGPWNLGRWSPLIGWVAVAWVIFICVLFVLPPLSPVDVTTFNYAPVAVLVVLAFATVSWFVGGRHRFMLAAKDQPTSREAEKVLDS
jgi:amino acid transporter